MSDYKNMIAGTLSSLMGKAKDAMESSGVRGVYQQGASRAKSYGRIAKLTLEMNGHADELSKVYTEIGKLYFDQNRTSPEGFFAPLFAQAETLQAAMRDKEAEIAALKEELAIDKAEEGEEPDIEVEISEFEDIVNATEEDGKQ